MSENYLYPENVDLTEPASPEILALWDDAMADLRKRRNRAALWQIPLMLVIVPLPIFFNAGLLWTTVLGLSLVLGLIDFTTKRVVLYKTSEDRRSAQILLKRRFTWDKFRPHITDFINYAKKDAVNMFTVLVLLIVSPVVACFFLMLLSCQCLEFWNNQYWLKDFKAIAPKVGSGDNPPDSHVRGTKVHPPQTLTGDPPQPLSSEAEDKGMTGESMEILDGKLTLYANGSLMLMGGATFDANSSFENLKIGDLVLTRKDAGLLRVHYEGEDHAFFYNGSEWSKV